MPESGKEKGFQKDSATGDLCPALHLYGSTGRDYDSSISPSNRFDGIYRQDVGSGCSQLDGKS